jgi:hypothetical protein
MPTVLTDNAAYLKFGTLAVEADLMEVSITFSNNDVDVTRGIQGHTMLAKGLNSTTLKVTLAWTDTNRASIMSTIKPGEILEVDWGPEGNTAGKPRHKQKFKISSIAHTQTANKDVVKFEIDANGAEAPSIDIYNGGTF